jgi:hypothetical protein
MANILRLDIFYQAVKCVKIVQITVNESHTSRDWLR